MKGLKNYEITFSDNIFFQFELPIHFVIWLMTNGLEL